jgi:hypothetical protein
MPTRVRYHVNDNFNSAGMVIKGITEDGQKIEIKNYETRNTLFNEEGLETVDIVYGQHKKEIKVRVVKNKVAPPFKVAEVELIFGKGISYEGEVLDMATNMDIVQKSGSWFSYNGERLGQGRENIKEMLVNNQELTKELETKIREKLKG